MPTRETNDGVTTMREAFDEFLQNSLNNTEGILHGYTGRPKLERNTLKGTFLLIKLSIFEVVSSILHKSVGPLREHRGVRG